MKVVAQSIAAVLTLIAVVLFPAHLIAQGTQEAQPSAQMVGEGLYSVLVMFYVPRILGWLKNQSWFSFMERGEFAMNRVTAFTVAACAALSIHYSFSHGADGWSLVIGGPHKSVIGFIGQVLLQYGGQQTSYEVMLSAAAAKTMARG